MSNLLVFALSRYFFILLFCAAAYPIGLALLRRLRFDGFAERFAICSTLGLGVISHLVLLCGLLGWLTAPGIIAVILAATTLGLVFRPKMRLDGTGVAARAPWQSRSRLIAVVIGLALAAFAMFPVLLLPLYPPTEFDVTAYHLVAPKQWLRLHWMAPTPFLRYQVAPSLAHLLFTALMSTHDDISPQILSLAATGLVAIAIYALGKRLRGPRIGLVAASFWMGSPLVLECSHIAGYHALAALFCFAGIYALSVYVIDRQLGFLFVAVIFTGFAQSTWSGAFYFVPVIVVAAVFFWIRERRVTPAWIVTAGLLAGWGPTLLRSAWYTGNPTYPLFTQLFGTGPWWTSEDFRGIANDIQSYGVPRTIKDFITLPYSLLVSPSQFQQTCSFSPALVILAPLILVRAVWDKVVRWLAVLAIYYLLCWFFIGQVMRYLVPIVPVFCVAVALTVCWGVDALFRDRRGRFGRLTILLASLALLVPGAAFAWRGIQERGPIPVTKEGEADYIRARLPEYNAVMAANIVPGPLYALLANNCGYYVNSDVMGDWFGPGRYPQVLSVMGDAEKLNSTLRRLGADYFLINRPQTIDAQVLAGAEFDRYFEPIYGDSVAEVYRVLSSARPGSVARKNLLANPGFDELSDGRPTSWDRRGAPVVGAPEAGVSSGTVAVEASDSDGFQQIVEVVPGRTYELALQAKAGPRGKTFRLQIAWLDEKNETRETCIRLFEATSDWRRYLGRFTAPPSSTRAQIYASGHQPDWVWMDSFEFNDMGGHNRSSLP